MTTKLVAVALASAISGFIIGRQYQLAKDIVEVEKMCDDIVEEFGPDPLSRNHKVSTKKSYGRFGEL